MRTDYNIQFGLKCPLKDLVVGDGIVRKCQKLQEVGLPEGSRWMVCILKSTIDPIVCLFFLSPPPCFFLPFCLSVFLSFLVVCLRSFVTVI